jgi:hypothetical protein
MSILSCYILKDAVDVIIGVKASIHAQSMNI